MSISKEKKQELIVQYAKSEGDTGSVEVQCAILTSRIEKLTGHFKTNPKDHNSRRGLLILVGRRRRLLDYVAALDKKRYEDLVKKLGIRK